MAKILVVDDEPDLRDLIAEHLEDAGHSCIRAANGQEGLDFLVRESPDLVVSDISMPVMNGYQFLRTLKERHPDQAHLPFLFLSALADREDELKGLRLGVDDYLTKPVDYDVLIARVDARLRRRQGIRQPPAGQAAPTDPAAQAGQRRTGVPEPESVDKVARLIERDSGELIAGKIQTVSLEAIRDHVGERWPAVAEKVLQIAERIIRGHIGADDVVHISSSEDFLICFAEADARQAAFKVETIRNDIWERLFGETGDGLLAMVSGESHQLSFGADSPHDRDRIFEEIEKRILSSNRKLIENARDNLEKIYSFEDLYFTKLVNRSGATTKLRRLAFTREIGDKVAVIKAASDLAGDFLLELNETLFERIVPECHRSRVEPDLAIVIPAPFALLENGQLRKAYTDQCQALADRSRHMLIIEIVDTPDRLGAHIEALKPLPVGRQLQFLEVRKPQQVKDIDLRSLRVAFVSMPYDYALHHGESELGPMRQKLHAEGVKLHVQNVPDGKLIDAQALHADLYSTCR